jgi:disease resistance protein RPS2
VSPLLLLLLCNPNMPTQIRAWKAKFDGLFQNLDRVFSIYANAQQIVAAAAPREDLLLQPVPDSGYIGLGIRSAQDQLQTWLTEPHCQSRVIGVYGMAGVGKTSLLKVIYNTYKEEVSGIFDFVVWFVVSQNFQIKELQASIAKQLKLNLEETSILKKGR